MNPNRANHNSFLHNTATLDPQRPISDYVRVYRNLRNGRLSILGDTEKGLRVVGYTDRITLHFVGFRVHQAGRERVLATKRKNVHAFVCGYLGPSTTPLTLLAKPITIKYNPYKYSQFVNAATEEHVYHIHQATVFSDGHIIAHSY